MFLKRTWGDEELDFVLDGEGEGCKMFIADGQKKICGVVVNKVSKEVVNKKVDSVMVGKDEAGKEVFADGHDENEKKDFEQVVDSARAESFAQKIGCSGSALDSWADMYDDEYLWGRRPPEATSKTTAAALEVKQGRRAARRMSKRLRRVTTLRT